MTSLKVSGPEAARLVNECGAVLYGQDIFVQGAVLADLLAMWLAAHVVAGDTEATKTIRENLLKAHIEQVRELIPVNERMMIEKLAQVATRFGKN